MKLTDEEVAARLYGAYLESLTLAIGPQVPFPGWDDLSPMTRDAWLRAATECRRLSTSLAKVAAA